MTESLDREHRGWVRFGVRAICFAVLLGLAGEAGPTELGVVMGILIAWLLKRQDRLTGVRAE